MNFSYLEFDKNFVALLFDHNNNFVVFDGRSLEGFSTRSSVLVVGSFSWLVVQHLAALKICVLIFAEFVTNSADTLLILENVNGS